MKPISQAILSALFLSITAYAAPCSDCLRYNPGETGCAEDSYCEYDVCEIFSDCCDIEWDAYCIGAATTFAKIPEKDIKCGNSFDQIMLKGVDGGDW